nr:hypothetical protein BaRGS_035073 [Batillaria attramentaria]
MQQKIQTVFNTCLRRIFNIRCPEKIRNEELWERAGQEPVAKQILRRKWGWIGHTLRNPASSTTRQALTWNPQGKRKRGWPRNSWRRDTEAELSKQGTNRVGLARTAQNRSRFGAHSLRTYGRYWIQDLVMMVVVVVVVVAMMMTMMMTTTMMMMVMMIVVMILMVIMMHRTQWYQGPIQPIQTVPGRSYRAHSWVKLMNDKPGKLFQNVQLEVSFAFPDGTHHYINVGYWPLLSTSDGWVFVEGDVQTPDRAYNVSKFYYQGPDPGVDFAVDLASVTEVTIDHDWRRKTNAVIDQVRKSDVHFRLKLRGHNMVWSVEQFIPDWVKTKSGDELRNTVRRHIQQLCNLTNGLAQHWDVNNEELHGQWFQERLQDPDYDLELFRMAHQYCPDVKLFLNDYDVVSQGSTTGEHIDRLAQSNVPIWVTELTCDFADEHRRADCYETALRATYGHPKIEGIIMWGVWDQDHYLGESGSLVVGNDLKLTEAGRRVLDLYENQWMTDETHVLSQAGNQFTVRGFHGDYEVHVRYNGHELSNLKQTFTLGKADKTIHLNVHT